MSSPVTNTMLRLSAPPSPAGAQRPGGHRNDDEGPDQGFSQALDQRMNNAERPAPHERQQETRRAPASERPRTETRRRDTEQDEQHTQSAPSGASTAPAETKDAAQPAPGETSSEATAPPALPTEPAPTAATPAAPGIEPVDPASLAALVAGIAAVPAETAAPGEIVLSSDDPLEGRNPNTGAYSLGKLIAEAGGKPGRNEQAAEVIDDKLASLAAARTARVSNAGENAAQALAARPQAAQAAASPIAPGLQALQPDAQAAGLHANAFTPTALRADSPVAQFSVHTPAGQAAWAEDVANRVTWIVGRHDSKAELVLTPAHLGKLEISIQMNGDQTTAHFVAATAAARDALEQALPRLRELLQQAGINLGQANVSTSGDQRAQQDERPRGSSNRIGATETTPVGSAATPAISSAWLRSGSGMVDTFA